ncbi:MAG TPA: luciferase family protein [Candidatus Saccharimonadales bacterium]|nr:luciferase family protein [Candidatus Saccharimonadales bacterium]
MFYFVVRHFRWLARVPGLPHFFDAMLVIVTWISYRSRLKAMENLEAEALRLPGVRLRTHRFGGIEFVDEMGRELGHLHGNGLLDVPVGNEAAASLLASGRVKPHHVFPGSKWISFQIETQADIPLGLELLVFPLLRRAQTKS